jgi:hypothetical protein
VGWHIVLMKDPVFCDVWMTLHDPLSQSFKNFCVVILTDCLSSRISLFVNNAHGIKAICMHFTFDLDMCAFFGLGGRFECHSKL